MDFRDLYDAGVYGVDINKYAMEFYASRDYVTGDVRTGGECILHGKRHSYKCTCMLRMIDLCLIRIYWRDIYDDCE